MFKHIFSTKNTQLAYRKSLSWSITQNEVASQTKVNIVGLAWGCFIMIRSGVCVCLVNINETLVFDAAIYPVWMAIHITKSNDCIGNKYLTNYWLFDRLFYHYWLFISFTITLRKITQQLSLVDAGKD